MSTNQLLQIVDWFRYTKQTYKGCFTYNDHLNNYLPDEYHLFNVFKSFIVRCVGILEEMCICKYFFLLLRSAVGYYLHEWGFDEVIFVKHFKNSKPTESFCLGFLSTPEKTFVRLRWSPEMIGVAHSPKVSCISLQDNAFNTFYCWNQLY